MLRATKGQSANGRVGSQSQKLSRKRPKHIDNRQLVFVPVDSPYEVCKQGDSFVATSLYVKENESLSATPSERDDSSVVALVDSPSVSRKQRSAVVLSKEECSSSTTDSTQLQSSNEETQDSQSRQDTTQNGLSFQMDSSSKRIQCAKSTQVFLEAGIAQLENSVCRREGVANMGFLQLTCIDLDTLLTYLWKMACPCFCFHLQGNRLSSLPDSIKLFSEHITHLYLQDNKLQVFPSTLCCLKNLKVLDLSRNCLESVPEEIINLQNLVILDISHNNIEYLPTSVWRMPLLKTIHYSGNPKMNHE
ncbi:hypothetical protein GAYE_PCTG33G0893 [Galdieria yellowstonensis]|uniref:Uncharacterized protein n=1 Tax=Galdieria yellowstonensis TaxID=3028027 RepID=A0AAV9I614_9RHOD|nr:hypothetical protein GAYE_PCTG33G0893 [Galdieria yellowstonensis]